jgi:predicted O-methyltransferase YrrM
MIRRKFIEFYTRLLRASLHRIATDIELAKKMHACISSAQFAMSAMPMAKPVSSRTEVLELSISTRNQDGFICELGVYRGDSLNYIASKISGSIIYGFDTFEGLPENWRNSYVKGTFETNFNELKLMENCHVYKGLFNDTLPIFLQDITSSASFIHVDCDLYTSTADALKLLAPRIKKGTILVFDEYFNYPGWEDHEHKAFQEFLKREKLEAEYLFYNQTGEQVAARIL